MRQHSCEQLQRPPQEDTETSSSMNSNNLGSDGICGPMRDANHVVVCGKGRGETYVCIGDLKLGGETIPDMDVEARTEEHALTQLNCNAPMWTGKAGYRIRRASQVLP